MTNTLGVAGNSEVRLYGDPARAIGGDAERCAHRRCRDAGSPQNRGRFNRARRALHASWRQPRDRRAGPHFDAKPLEISSRGVAERLGERAEQRRASLEEQDARRAGIEMPEIARERLPRHLGERAGELDAGRASADDDERQQRAAASRDRSRARPARRPAARAGGFRAHPRASSDPARCRATPRVRSTRAWSRSPESDSRTSSRRRPAPPSAARDRRAGRPRAAPRRSPDGAGSSGWARRCRRETERRPQPDTARAETRDGCGGPPASRPRGRAQAPAPHTGLQSRRRR